MPTRQELIAPDRSDEEIAREIRADMVIYQDLDALKASITEVNPALTEFETSCFDGIYVTGDVTREYLAKLEKNRAAGRQDGEEDSSHNQLDLNAA
jgi:amidophosphoribosyltransferase